MTRRILVIFGVLFLLAIVCIAQESPRFENYSLTIIEPPNASYTFLSVFNSINEPHRIVGGGGTILGPGSFEYLHDNYYPLEPLDGWELMNALSINNRGDVVGAAASLYPSLTDTPVLWVNGVPQDLGYLNATDNHGIARDVNNRGQIVGESGYAASLFSSDSLPFIWEKGIMSQLPLPLEAINGTALGINDPGQAVGSYTYQDMIEISSDLPFQILVTKSNALVWEKDRWVQLQKLNSDGLNGQALGINNQGQVVGSSSITGYLSPSTAHATLWDVASPGSPIDLHTFDPTLSSRATSINGYGEVVGDVCVSMGPYYCAETHAFLWVDGEMYDLNDLVSTESDILLTAGGSINNRGQIAGLATYEGRPVGFLLTPNP